MRRIVLKLTAALVVTACCSGVAFGAEELLLETKQVRITNADFEASLVRIPQENRFEVLASKERIRKLLENLVISKTLAAKARSAGIDRDPEMRKQIELAAENVLAQAYLNQQIKALKLPNFDARAHELYQVNIEKYTSPARVRASHILVEIKNRTPEEALQRIQDVRAQALSGKSFEALAQEYSDDPSAKSNKGDLGFFEPGRMVKPFSDAAFAMNTPGEISEPVKTGFGYHIIQFHEKQPKQTRPFEAVKQEIVEGLKEQYIAQYRQKQNNDILTDPSMKLYEEAVNRYQTHLDAGNVEQQKK
ncbi:MAG: foldase protein PrsA [Sulfuricella sp.]